MTSVIYTCATGVDPGDGELLTDPLFGPVPTLGACVPNLRRIVERGDWIFVVSGKRKNLPQYVIGGLRVGEKIDALAAYDRFPGNRMIRDEQGVVRGNVPIDEHGRQHPLDGHPADGFERRVRNYIVGDQFLKLVTPAEVALGRDQTLNLISELRKKQGNRIIDVMGRSANLAEPEVERMLQWLRTVKQAANGQSQ